MHFVSTGARVLHAHFRPGTPGKRPIVFSNSLGTDLRIWDAVIAGLPGDIPVLSMDKSGHGLSDAGAVTVEDHAADLAAVMDHFGLSGALVCGVSMGGLIAQALATTRPELVAGLVLSNTAAKIGTAQAWADRIAALEAGGLEPMAEGILQRWFSGGYLANETTLVAGYRNMLTRTPLSGYIAACAAIRDADLTASTAALSIPVTCLAGSADQATPPEVVQGLADLIPGATYLEIEGIGHIPGIEVPEQVTAILAQDYERLA